MERGMIAPTVPTERRTSKTDLESEAGLAGVALSEAIQSSLTSWVKEQLL